MAALPIGARFLFEVLEACRNSAGNDILVGVRINADESNENGLTAEEGIETARMIGRHGVADIVNVNGAYGGTERGLTETMPGMAWPVAPYIELAGRVREASGLVTLQAARLSDPATADWAVSEGYVDMAGMTRPHMADPDIVNKLVQGEAERIRPCVGAGYCLDRIYGGRDALCQHNVSTGRESWLGSRIARAAEPGRAVVVGAGPAGLEAARVLALRGHAVTLFEAATRTGGQVLLAAAAGWRRDMIGIIDWLAGEVDHAGVDVRTGTFVEGDDVARLDPDVVIVASGSVPETGLAEGGGEHVMTVWDALESGQRPTGHVVIADATGRSCRTLACRHPVGFSGVPHLRDGGPSCRAGARRSERAGLPQQSRLGRRRHPHRQVACRRSPPGQPLHRPPASRLHAPGRGRDGRSGDCRFRSAVRQRRLR